MSCVIQQAVTLMQMGQGMDRVQEAFSVRTPTQIPCSERGFL